MVDSANAEYCVSIQVETQHNPDHGLFLPIETLPSQFIDIALSIAFPYKDLHESLHPVMESQILSA